MFKYAVTTYGDLIRELISEDVDCYHEKYHKFEGGTMIDMIKEI